ncbi:MAG: ComEC/Rec2 family competence protein [Clostridia bacterium]|nr:ComEC/Rec2 family competence protein [Clostridia bacterium]
MYLLISLAYTLKRDTDSFNVLCGAVVLILIFSPFAIFNIGFELSVFATFAVAVIAPKINEKIKINSKALKAVAFVATNSLMAQIVTLPITVYYFESISLIAPITNVLISYAVTFDLILSLIGVISNFFFGGAVSRFVFLVADILTKYINTVINKLGEISFASVKLSGVFAGLFALTVFVIIIVLYTCNHKEILVKLKLIKAGEENVDNI